MDGAGMKSESDEKRLSNSPEVRKWPDVCLAVLNWNGQCHLEILIPSLLDACAVYPGECVVAVLDNPSGADDLEWLREKFPEVEGIRAEANDFLYSYNGLLANRNERIVVLLNNDLRVDPGFLAPLVEPFADSRVFSVGAKSLEWDGSAASSEAYRAKRHRGWYYWEGFPSDVACPTVFAVGGFAAVDRRKFLELGGFDRLFHPAYGEDSDLCLRAWERGWKSIYQPASVVWHREGASWNGEQAEKRDYLMTRAQYLMNRRYFHGLGDRLVRWIYIKITGWRRGKDRKAWKRAIRDARQQWLATPVAARQRPVIREVLEKRGLLRS